MHAVPVARNIASGGDPYVVTLADVIEKAIVVLHAERRLSFLTSFYKFGANPFHRSTRINAHIVPIGPRSSAGCDVRAVPQHDQHRPVTPHP